MRVINSYSRYALVIPLKKKKSKAFAKALQIYQNQIVSEVNNVISVAESLENVFRIETNLERKAETIFVKRKAYNNFFNN